MKKIWFVTSYIILLAVVSTLGAARALGDDESQIEDDESKVKRLCPVGLVSGKTLDDEFGPGTKALTTCLGKRTKVKLLVQINRYCNDDVPNGHCKRPYALGSIVNAIKDYQITHGMRAGIHYEIAAIVHSGGGHLMIQNDYAAQGNPFAPMVRSLLDQGVRFYLCQNTARSFVQAGHFTPGHVTSEVIPGVEYVTAGITAIGDFQVRGWTLFQP